MQASASPRVIAHRGSSTRWPEHTRAAYLQALADGADGLECDVRLTSDGVPVCWHDVDVDRTSDGTGPVHAHTLTQLRQLDVSSWAQPDGAPGVRAAGIAPDQPAVITLAELVDLVRRAGRPVHLAIELKHPSPYGFAAEDAVLAVLERAGWDAGTATVGDVGVSLMSFHPGSLEHLAGAGVPGDHLMVLLDDADPLTVARQHARRRGTTLLLAAALRRLVSRAERLAASGAVGGVGPSVALVRAHPQRVRRWQENGRLVRVWTVDDPDDLELCRELGVDEVTTNVPDEVLSRLGRGPGGSAGAQGSR